MSRRRDALGQVLFKNAAVFDGTTPHLRQGCSVLVEDALIREVSEQPISHPHAQVVDAAGRTLMPGLIDLHVHIWWTELDATKVVKKRSEYIACFAASSLRRSLDYGFTTLRDAGGADPSYVAAIDRGFIPGPRFYPSGRMMCQTGGHVDMREPDADDVATLNPPVGGLSRFTAIVDGPDDMRRAVREELRRGATQIKLMLSGGISSPSDPLDKIQFTDEEIRTAVNETDRRGTYCFAHCHPLNSIWKAIEHRIRTIEHGTFIDDEAARAVVENGLYVVPTLAVVWALNESGRELGYPEVSLRKLQGISDTMLRSLEIMKRTGVKMGFGTDLLGPHQVQQTREFTIRSEVLPALDILQSATSIGAEILGESGRLGVVAPGATADLIVVDGDPLSDISVLDRKGESLSVIMKEGRFHKLRI
jgi:imidazolonepropionase-like amidohydrolase